MAIRNSISKALSVRRLSALREFDMTLNRFRNWFAFAASSVVLAIPALAAPPIKNVALAHGAFVDGSGWQPVYDILVKDGYKVTVVHDPLTFLEEDVAATKRILDRQPAHCILVGHSYGGAVVA
jgi:pimeloyl-ACP methyl ester carboxylesterase